MSTTTLNFTVNLSALAQEIGSMLAKNHAQIVTAESCTGGGIGFWLTSVSGASQWYQQGFITYSNHAKKTLLGVSALTLEEQGAVSEATAIAMAVGALNHSEADISIASTGIAGPTGGTPTKPVGTVWLATAKRDGSYQTQLLQLTGSREHIRNESIRQALLLTLNILR